MKKQILKISIFVAILSFSFLIMPISVLAYGLTTYDATNVTDTSATFRGKFSTDNNKSEPTWFEYSYRDPNWGDNDPRTHTLEEYNYGGTVFYKTPDAPLFPNTTYYYRACFKHAGTHCQSYNVPFRTKPAPTIPVATTNSATVMDGMNTNLNGSWTSNGNSTNVWFQYGTDPSLTTSSATYSELRDGSGSINQIIGNLKLNTTYYFKFAARNRVGTSYGQIKSFKTPNTYSPSSSLTFDYANSSVATVTTCGTTETNKILPAVCNGNKTDNISDIKATLRGTAKPDTQPTTVYFRYTDTIIPPVFCNDIYGSDMISTRDISLTAEKSFEQNINNLVESTKYYYCAIVSSNGGIKYGEVKSFTTLPCQECIQTTVTTKDAIVVDQTSAYLKGSYSSTEKIKTYFEYKKDTSTATSRDGTGTPDITLGEAWKKIDSSEQTHNANFYGDASFLLSDLKAGTKYKFHFVAKTVVTAPEISKTFHGSDLSFTTSGNGGNGLERDPEENPLSPNELYDIENPGGVYGGYDIENPGGVYGGSGTGGGTAPGNLVLGQIATPPSDAIVRYQEGIETVFVRQIIANKELARRYGYIEGVSSKAYAWELADLFARVFGYIAGNGKEIRVSPPDMAAYQLLFVGNKLMVYEYFNNRIMNIQSMTETLRSAYEYEYYFRK